MLNLNITFLGMYKSISFLTLFFVCQFLFAQSKPAYVLYNAKGKKDATMAYFILKNHVKGSLSLHFNGAYHSDNFEGILWYLRNDQPGLNYSTITTVSQAEIKKLAKENKGKANYIICVDEDLTTTY